MDKMSRKPTFKVPSPGVPEIGTAVISPNKVMDSISKWVPLICAGSAIGIGIFALKEIKSVRKELVTIKKEQNGGANEKIEQKMEDLEKQLKTITEFLKNNQREQRNATQRATRDPPRREETRNVAPKPQVIVKNAISVEEVPEEVKIINDTQEDEYEEVEVEVTDDEEEN